MKIDEFLFEAGLTLKLPAYAHQEEGFFRSYDKASFAHLSEMGCGKTAMLIWEMAWQYRKGFIDSALVIAPKGVDENWMKDEIRLHMPEGIIYTCALWRASARKKQRIALAKLMGRNLKFGFDQKDEDLGLRIMLCNWDAISTERGFETVCEFLENRKALIVADEAHKVKAPKTKRAKALLKIKPMATVRRIATGTPVNNCPFDVFVPFTFLDERILETDSYVAFKAEYAQMLKPSSPFYQALFQKQVALIKAKGQPGISQEQIEAQAKRRIPQIVAKDDSGNPMWKNLKKLQELLDPHSFRKLKDECLDLPPKIFKKLYFDMTEEQEAVYLQVKEKARLVLDDKTIQPLTALTAVWKLCQITSGFFIETTEHLVHRIPGENPKAEVLRSLMEDIEGKTIIWANFVQELRDVREACKGHLIVEYHGGVRDADRAMAIEQFQHGDADVFIGNPRSGGTGLTLTAAQNMIYYSNNYSMDTRKQSEDRAHRIGQTKNLLIWDLVASGTIEERIIEVLQTKSDLAALINGDLLKDDIENQDQLLKGA